MDYKNMPLVRDAAVSLGMLGGKRKTKRRKTKRRKTKRN
jgi:hypothetical protein